MSSILHSINKRTVIAQVVEQKGGKKVRRKTRQKAPKHSSEEKMIFGSYKGRTATFAHELVMGYEGKRSQGRVCCSNAGQ